MIDGEVDASGRRLPRRQDVSGRGAGSGRDRGADGGQVLRGSPKGRGCDVNGRSRSRSRRWCCGGSAARMLGRIHGLGRVLEGPDSRVVVGRRGLVYVRRVGIARVVRMLLVG